jgi:leucyl/phenylalanyl-tRNA--protein transferase
VRLAFTPAGVISAYASGVFPMAESATGDIYWFRPDPRAIIPLDGFHISRSLAKRIRSRKYEIRVNTDFRGVMAGCADREEGSWISEDFHDLYGILHRAGIAHSVETWRGGTLVGGVYGLAIGAAFMAESMFHRETDASKVALAALVERLCDRGFSLLDVQYLTPHLQSLGAIEIPDHAYQRSLRKAVRLGRSFASPEAE